MTLDDLKTKIDYIKRQKENNSTPMGLESLNAYEWLLTKIADSIEGITGDVKLTDEAKNSILESLNILDTLSFYDTNFRDLNSSAHSSMAYNFILYRARDIFYKGIYEDFIDNKKKVEEQLDGLDKVMIKLKDVIDKKDDLSKKVEKIYNDGMLGQARRYANGAKWLAHWMLFLAFLLMILSITMTIAPSLLPFVLNLNFTNTLLDRLILPVLFLFPISYCIVMSKQQRLREFHLRDFEVQGLSLLAGYMDSLKISQENRYEADKTKLDLAKLVLINNFSKDDNYKEGFFNKDELRVLKEVMKVLGKNHIPDLINSVMMNKDKKKE